MNEKPILFYFLRMRDHPLINEIFLGNPDEFLFYSIIKFELVYFVIEKCKSFVNKKKNEAIELGIINYFR